MKPTRNSFFTSLLAHSSPVVAATFVISLCSTQMVSAASQIWDGDTDVNWNTAANWVGNAIPGIVYTTNGTNTADVATFNAAINATTLAGSSGTPIITETNRMIGRIVFDTVNAGSYFIGAAATPPTLTFGNGLTILDVTASVGNPQTINSPVALHLPSSTNGAATIQNNSTSSSATLNLVGGILNSPNSTRGTAWTIGGSNTGANTINLITISNTGGISSSLTKTGTGQWIIAGTNTISGGVIVSDGTLVAQSGGAFGAAALTVNGGIVRLDGGITLGNSNATLNNSGEIRSNGSNNLNKLTVGTTLTAPVISTVSAGDVFTIGSVANNFTGGVVGTALHIAGPGTVFLGQSSNYIGLLSVDAGTLKVGNAGALGTGGVTFGPSSTGTLLLNGISATAASLSTDAVAGTPVVENNNAVSSTLTVGSSTGTSNYAGVLRDGVTGGGLALTKSGASTLTLSGAANTYSGGTTVTGGSLFVTNSSGSSATGTGSVTVNGGALGGSGYISGAVTLDAAVSPGVGGVGTLTVGSLTLGSGAQLNYDITSTSDLDLINVNGSLTVIGGQVNINGGSTPFTTNGTYKLIGGFTGTPGVAGLSVNPLNKDITKNYTFAVESGFVVLKITNSSSAVSYWNADASGNWSTGPWTTPTPNASGAFASFGGGGIAITSPRTVTVNGLFSVGTFAFNNATKSFTLASGGIGTGITLDNGASSALVSDFAGSHVVQSIINLSSNGTTVSVLNTGDTLTLSGTVSGGGTVTKIGSGSLVLSAINDYTGDTLINAGTVVVNNANSLGTESGLVTISGGTLLATEDITTTRNFNITDPSSAFSVDGTKTFSISGTIGAGTGTLNKLGLGALVLTGVNSYSGGTVITEGTLNVNSDLALGSVPGAAVANITFNPGTGNSATLQFGNFSPSANRSLVFSSGTAVIDTQSNTVAFSGASSGIGGLVKTGSGILQINSGQNYSGGTVVNGGTLAIRQGGGIVGDIAMKTGTSLSLLNNGSGSVFVGNAINMDPASTITLLSNNTANGYSSNITGDNDSVINVGNGGSSFNFALNTKQLQNFYGTLKVPAGSTMDQRFNGVGSNGSDNATFVVDGTVTAKNAGTWTFGALSSTESTGVLGGANNYVVGGLGSDTIYAGNITSTGATGLTKVGSGILTLTGTGNTYLGTTITGGTLQIGNSGTTGSLGTGTVNVAAGGILSFKRSDAITVANTITGNGELVQNGSGILFLTGTNSYAGKTTINAGTLNINGQFALGGAVYGGLDFNGGSLQYATAFTGNGDGDITKNSLGDPVPVNIDAGGAIIDTNGNDVAYANPMGSSGTGGIVKTGPGTLTLNGANTYTGATTVSVGILALTGDNSDATGNVSVSSGATVAGAGKLGGSLTINSGGHLALAVADLPVNQLTRIIAGTLNLESGNVLDLSAAIAPATGTYVLATAASIVGLPTTVVLPSGVSGSVTVVGGTTLQLTVGPSSPYDNWATTNITTINPTADATPSGDPDNDGVKNILEFVLGGNPLSSSTSVVPSLTVNATNFVFTFNRSDASEAEAALQFQWGTALATWPNTVAVGAVSSGPDANGVTVTVDEGTPTSNPDVVTVTVPRTNAVAGKIFGRLEAVK